MQEIFSAKFIIAEITPENQNVFFEVGYAHAMRKPIIFIAEKGKCTRPIKNGSIYYKNI